MIKSLFGKIFTSHIALILIFTLTLGLFLSHVITEYLIESKRDDLYNKGIAATRFLDATLDNKKVLNELIDGLSELSGAQMFLMDKSGKICAGMEPGPSPRNGRDNHNGQNLNKHHQRLLEKAKVVFEQNEPCSWIQKTPQNDEDPAISVVIPFKDHPDVALFMRTPIQGLTKTSTAITNLLLSCLMATLILAAILAYFVSRNLTKPISDITKAAQNFANGDYDSRTTAIGTDEIGNLGSTFNAMATSLATIEKNRRDFFSDVTHELKTPLAAIQALTESMLDGVIDSKEEQQRYLSTIVKETTRMNHLINDLLDLARLESLSTDFKSERLFIKDFTESLQLKYSSLLEDKNLHFSFSYDENTSHIITDIRYFEQIFANLISNAIRYSFPDSMIKITFAQTSQCLQATVENSGHGIPEKDLSFIWDRFYRVEKSRSRENGGTGLGLSITKQLVERMGGTITVQSTINDKTIFKFTLPQPKNE